MKTGAEYRQSLADGRATYFEGRRIDDLLGHPLLGQSVDLVARGYDRWYAPGEAARNPLMTIPLSADDLRARIPMQHGADIVALVTYQAVMTLTTAAGRIDPALPRYAERIRDYVDGAQRDDIRITECITDAKGDRSLPPRSKTTPTPTRASWIAAATESSSAARSCTSPARRSVTSSWSSQPRR
jgi:4-hydroxybutyryl-CoA dehydratase/vinylacetyl-CoA-Delta-isomerase